jgi:transcriptional regulator with XRE-family HTH domain
MAHKVKDIIKSNTYEIRKEQELSQDELGEQLGVSARMIQHYEAGSDYSLPIEKAMLMHDKWNYSLDQIYLDFSKKPSSNKFSIDIRDFFSINGEKITFSIPDYYWKYLRDIKKINESDSLKSEKKRLIKRLEGNYTNKSNSIIWKYEIPISDFISLIKVGNKEIPYADADNSDFVEPSEEQINEISSFLDEITKGDHN